MLWILLVILLVFALMGAPPVGWYPHAYGWYPSGIGFILVIILILLILRA